MSVHKSRPYYVMSLYGIIDYILDPQEAIALSRWAGAVSI